MREREAKLAVDDDYEVPALEQRLAEIGAELLASKQRTIADVYYDTADLRLLRRGCTLRHRKGSGWTVKLPVTSDASSLTRNEIDLGGRAGRPPPQARKLVTSFSRREPLVVVARVTTGRTIRPVRSTDGQPLLEIADDVVSTEATDGPATSFRQIEVELAEDCDPGILGPILQELTDAGARPQPDGIKLAIALGQPPLDPEITVPKLPKRPSARHVVHTAIARSVDQLIVQLPFARLGQDPEGIHQARVATRRLRSDLRTFKPLLDPDWATALHPRLRDLTDHLGRVRDADVLHQLLLTTLGDHPEIDAVGGDGVLGLLSEQRQQALASLEAHLDQPETDQLLDDLVAAAGDPPTTAAADGPAKEKLPPLVNRRWRTLERAAAKLGSRPPASALHEVRILAKRTRYATEAIAPAFGTRTDRFARSLAALQDTLGDLNDASIANRWLSENAPQLDPGAAFVAGRLVQALHDGASANDRWRVAWKAVDRRRPNWLG